MSLIETECHIVGWMSSLLMKEGMPKERSIQRFGEKLHTLRTQKGLTLKELAHQLGHVAHGYISELEAGKKLPTAELVLSIARLFNVTTDELLKDEIELRGADAGQPLEPPGAGRTTRSEGDGHESSLC